MPLHHHKKHWLLHATMWVSALCVLIACGFVTWKFQSENKLLVQQMSLLLAENGNVKGELSICTKKKNGLEKSVEDIADIGAGDLNACATSGDTCNSDACLFSSTHFGQVAGAAKLTGYVSKFTGILKQSEDVGIDKDTPYECTLFVVTKGPELLISNALSTGGLGATKDEKGRVVFNIDPSTLPTDQKKKLMNSKESAPVDIDVLREATSLGFGPNPCYVGIDIYRVK